MTPHEFIFSPGIWLGEGKITFSTSTTPLKFYLKWAIFPEENQEIQAVQTIEIQGNQEQLVNQFIFSHIKSNNFSVILESEAIGKIQGKGVQDKRTIAWEFPLKEHFTGFEVYEKQFNGDFSFHAEYGETADFRNLIQGLIWKKKENTPS